MDYKTAAENESMYNTPPCWAIYVCGLVFEHLLKKGEPWLWAASCGVLSLQGLKGQLVDLIMCFMGLLVPLQVA
jgi:hypothetical protein